MFLQNRHCSVREDITYAEYSIGGRGGAFASGSARSEVHAWWGLAPLCTWRGDRRAGGLAAGACLAQQEKGDKEFGVDGAASIMNSPVSGMVFAQASFGKYLSNNNYIGAIAAPVFTFGSGNTSGGLLTGGEYRYLFGSNKTKRLWPFIGAQGDYFFERSGGVNQNLGVVAPEAGLKFYVSQKTAFEVSYLLQIEFGGGPYSGFGNRSTNLILFGFKHLF